MNTKQELDRRSFLKASIVAGGALVIGFNLESGARAAERYGLEAAPAADFKPNAFIKITKDGKVTVTVGQVEMGQGVYTSLPMIVADELEVDWANVTYDVAPADKAFINPAMGMQGTGGSSSVKGLFNPLRKSSAAVREMLVAAAAQGWNVAPDTCKAESGKVVHAASKRSIAYGELLDAAAKLTPPAEPKLKDPKDFKYIGKGMKRLDSPSKVNGSAVFGLDVKVPGMLYATILRCPVIGGKVKSVDDTAAKAVKGVTNVVPLGYGVGVVANSYYAARQGRTALKVTWDEGAMAAVSSETIFASFAEAADKEKGLVAGKKGDVAANKAGAAKTVEAVYWSPFVAHGTMEPMNFTADVRADGAEVWGGVQAQMLVQGVVAKTAGVPVEKVKVNTTLLGGGFGRRFEMDYVIDATLLSKTVGKPVKVVWTREDDMQNDFYRPATFNKMSAGINAKGEPVFWHHRVVNDAIMARAGLAFGFVLKPDQLDDSSFEGAHNLPYDFPNFQCDWVRKDTGVPVGFWRSVGSSHTAFSTECFLDEVAAAAGKDPVAFRLALLAKHPRHAAVVKLAAEKAGWSTKPEAGVFRGIAVHESFGSYVAQVAEVSVSKAGQVSVKRVVCAVDCGQVVNPDTVAAQMEGSIVYGLSAALYGEITLKGGRVQQKNFTDQKSLRMNEMPKVEVYIVPSTEKHGGVGEPGTPPIAPAVVNAIFAATGKRVRSLPIRAEDLKSA
ncbi:MAG: xanthine dehydrogenase family protein molybdopterin-binding subunit [Pyrinomonadaceae bacterium]|nr:xanthine dehydrogenase family protein molybdopterin-binding subunit [Pyrinomonadaceae bacterium]MBP6211854.1 xanthine dehydrogenase family protein molybdopterin-binding subunit [Pyrinomonadaceae bacterium]